MKITDIQNQYRSGAIKKSEYIQAMYEKHNQLFEYTDLLRHTDIENITITSHGIVWTTRPHGLRWLTPKADKRSAPFEILNFAQYEPEYFSMMCRLLEPGMSVFDIGANIGWYSLNFSKVVSDLHVWAFEPVPGTYRELENNIQLNAAMRIKPHNLGLSDRTGKLTFFVDPELSTSASAVNITEAANAHETECALETMDNFCEQYGAKPDFIKCDVEGAELMVYRGGKNTLQTHKPIVCTEMLRKWAAKYNYHPNDIITFFKEMGYYCFLIQNDYLAPVTVVDETTVETNFIFLHRERHANKIKTWVKS
ncbi:FkbM family methyltransferase [bacterium]|nr:FkbM family methyltransferase [bacterium]NUN46105.1 FkbM family methyltransferase [bacterium]